MGLSVIPNLLDGKPKSTPGPKSLREIAEKGRYYRHPDSAQISYPLVVQEPLGSVNKDLKIAIIGAGAAGIAALYELCRLENSSKHITVTIYEADPENFVHYSITPTSLIISGLKAGRISAARSGDESGGTDHAVYEIGAMRFPEIAGLMWHYVKTIYGDDKEVGVFPNPGAVPTEMIHGDRVDRFGGGEWLDSNSPTKKVVDVVRSRLFGSKDPPYTSLFQIAGHDPAKISYLLEHQDTTGIQLIEINEHWKVFAKKYDQLTLGSAVRQAIENGIEDLPDVDGLLNDTEKINHYVELFGTVGFGTGGFKPVYNMALIEMMRLLLWNYSNEYMLPTEANTYFIRDLYNAARAKNSKVNVKLARVCDVGHLDKNSEGETLVVSYAISPGDGSECTEPQVGIYNYVILAATPRQTSSMVSRIGFNNIGRKVTLGDYGRPLNPDDYVGEVRPALILSDEFETANSKIYTALNNVHMISSSKIFATVKKIDYEKYAKDFKNQGKIKAILSDCGLGSSYVVPSTIPDTNPSEAQILKSKNYYSFLISYAWEDVTKKLQHQFGKYPLNIDDTKLLMDVVKNRTIRDVKDPITNTLGPWWFGNAMSNVTLEDPLCYDWTTFHSSGAFKLDSVGDHFNTNLMFRYHTHALKPELKNKFFLANCSYSHLGGWIEGALMSAVNAVCGLIVAANGGDVNALNPDAQKVVESFDNVVENDE